MFIFDEMINAYLKLDPEMNKKLKNLNHQSMAFSITDWNIDLYCYVEDAQLKIYLQEQGKVDAKIKGPLKGFIKTAFAKEKNRTLLQNQMSISGDVDVAMNFQNLFSEMEIDWEEHLAKITGDVLAHEVGKFTRSIKDVISYAVKESAFNIKDFLQDEAGILINKKEAESFFSDIMLLQNDVDRLAAKIEKL